MAYQTETKIILPPLDIDPSVQNFARELKAPEFVATLLHDRGIEDKDAARDFFLTNTEEEDPMLIKGMPEAVELFKNIREKGEKVLVHGDYDVDGISGAALLYKGLRRLEFNVDWFLPNRFSDGYGLTLKNVEKFAAEGVRWIITVDTGINAVAEVKRAGELGMGVIITDHHQPDVEIPQAEIILNPNQKDCPYPNKQLCGAGVAYKLLGALSDALEIEKDPEILIYVALASLADIMPMRGENRAMVRHGLRLLQQTALPGFRELLIKTELVGKPLASSSVLFKITPLINAAGRLAGPEIAFKLLTTESGQEAMDLMNEMWQLNMRRKKLDRDATAEAQEMMGDLEVKEEDHCLVMASEDWHEGVIGIVAAKLVDKYSRPAFVMSINNGVAKGSGRTVEGFHLHKALGTCSNLFEKWGGHYFACGFTIPTANIPEFREAMQSLAGKLLGEESRTKSFRPRIKVTMDDINEESMTWLSRFEPTGPSNEIPLFYMDNLTVQTSPRVIGESHLKLTVAQKGIARDVIAFGLGHLKESLDWRAPLSMAFYPEWNFFQNRRTLQLRAVAIEESSRNPIGVQHGQKK